MTEGVRFFDMADSYGSHKYVGEAIKTLPREKSRCSPKSGHTKTAQTELPRTGIP